MHRTIVLILLAGLVLHGHALERREADSLSIAAREAYAAGDHAQALALFDSVYTAYTSPSLLYNIANCHFKLNDMARAILFYERAIRLAPADEDIQANLELARLQIMDRVSEMPRFSLKNALIGTVGGGDVDQWARRAIWLCIAAFLLLALAWLARNTIQKRVLFALAILSFAFTLTSTAFAYLRHSVLTDDREAIVLAVRADVRSEPGPGGTTLFVLHKGTRVTILQQIDDRYEVSLRNGNVGWIQAGAVEKI